jgi:hypothetical protein
VHSYTVRMCDVSVRPTLTYGSERWRMTRKDENVLRMFGRRISGKIYGPIKENSIWRLRYNHELYQLYNEPRSRGSSVSIVSGYGLDDRAIGVRSPAGARDFSCSLCVQTGSGAHPASCIMGTGGPFPGGKALPGRDADHSPHLVPRS